MALTETPPDLSEVNLRFRDGKLVSRECWNRIVIKRDDVVIHELGERAELSDEQLAAILGATTAGLTGQITALQADNKALEAERNAALADKAAAEKERDAATAAKDAAEAAKAALEA